MSSIKSETQGLPRRLGRYVLLSRLTEGGMTEVYAARLAEEVGPGRMLVIKVLPDSVGDDPDAESRFLAEARIVLNLTHGNITTAFEFGRDDAGRPFLVMEYVPGPSLRGLLTAVHEKRARLRVEDALFVVAEVLRALSYAHGYSTGGERGIVHRDISPDNIVISTSGQVKLTDFGIAHFVRARTFGPIFGKAAYIAPEVAGGASPSSASDIYSVGAVLYEALTGNPPFKGDDDKETLRQVVQEQPASISTLRGDISPELDTLVQTLLEKNPSERPGAAAQIEVRIRALLRTRHAAYTEADLAETVGKLFSPADFMDPTPRESLVKELEAAGIALTGEETTDELLENRTVPLDAAVLAQETTHGRPSLSTKPSPRRWRWYIGVPVLLIALIAAGRFISVPPDVPEPELGVDVDTALEKKEAQTIPEPASPVESESDADSEQTEQRAAATSSKPERPKGGGATKTARSRVSKKGDTDNGKQKSKGAEPREAAGEWGWLNINSYPWSYVKVDGKKLGGHTPHRRVKLKAGKHVLEFENPELNLKSKKTVEVSPWEEVNIGVRLGQ